MFPLRNPVEVAKLASSAAALSGGRVALGAGVGWMAEEFEILGEDFRTRGARTDEGIEICRKLWTGEAVSHDGRFYSFPTVTMSPAAPGGTVPVWIGGHSDPALRQGGPQRRLDRQRLPPRRGRRGARPPRGGAGGRGAPPR